MEKKGQTYSKMNAINWPKEFLPGTTDNFTSNEVIIKNLSTKDIWIFLEDSSLWSSYYKNIVDVKMKNQKSFRLNGLSKFKYTILVLDLDTIMHEFIPPEIIMKDKFLDILFQMMIKIKELILFIVG